MLYWEYTDNNPVMRTLYIKWVTRIWPLPVLAVGAVSDLRRWLPIGVPRRPASVRHPRQRAPPVRHWAVRPQQPLLLRPLRDARHPARRRAHGESDQPPRIVSGQSMCPVATGRRDTDCEDREKEKLFYLTTHSTLFIYGYMASDIWLRTILIVRKKTRCCHIGYSYRLTARVLLYVPSYR